jgi:hypothetical protein
MLPMKFSVYFILVNVPLFTQQLIQSNTSIFANNFALNLPPTDKLWVVWRKNSEMLSRVQGISTLDTSSIILSRPGGGGVQLTYELSHTSNLILN